MKQNVLTPKESEVVRRVAEGKSRKIIAHELGITTGTLDTHFKRIFSKLQTHSMVETALWAVKNGMLTEY